MLLFSGIAAALLIAFAVWFSAGGGEAPPPRGGIRAELAGSRSAEAVWLRRSEERVGGLETRLREMETKSRRFEGENAKLRESLTRGAEDGRAPRRTSRPKTDASRRPPRPPRRRRR